VLRILLNGKMMAAVCREFQIFAKPAGAACNLNCTYCYYLDKKNIYKGKHHFLMEDAVLEKYIKQHIQVSTESIINFSWHGGEPLLAGRDFFYRVVQLQKKHKPQGFYVNNGIQTNGTLLDDEWCRFLAAEGFTVGISIDGLGDMHNKNRRTRENNDTFQNVIRGYELLRKHGILPEILCVVNSDNVKYPIEIYNLFKQLRAENITFLPLVERENDSPNGVTSLSVPSEEFGVFLSRVFDEWVDKDIGKIKVQIFEEAARTAFNQDHTMCIFKVNCGGVPVVEHTGDFYSCDHYVDRDHLVGNILDHSLSGLLDSEKQKSFGQAKSLTLSLYCQECGFLQMCNGECPRNRFINTPAGEAGLNYLCSGYKYFFNHCRPFVEAISAAWESRMI
jgi:uncharacterized protein